MTAFVGTNRAGLTTRMPAGVTNAAQWQTMGLAGLPDPTWAHTFADDFDNYAAANYALSGTGTPTAALTPGNGGLILLSTTAGASDSVVFQKTPAAFAVNTAGKQTFFKVAGTLSSIAGAFYAGLANIGAGAESGITNGVVLYKAAGAGTLVLDIIVASTHTTFALPAASAIVAGTAFELGIAIDTVGNAMAFFNPTTGYNPQLVQGGVVGATFSRGAVAMASQPTLPTVSMAPVVSYVNASAAAQTITMDYLVTSVER